MSKLRVYVEDTYNELVNKVSWPTWKELQNSAVVVMIASFIIALVIYVMDKTFSTLMEQFYKMF